MVSVCFYFQVHQPFRLRRYRVFDIGKSTEYFDDAKNEAIAKKVAHKCYLPTNDLMLRLIRQHQGRFRISYSISGVALEQFQKYTPQVIDSFQRLAKTGCVEFLNETYYHSLSFLYSKDEFRSQVLRHRDLIKSLFGQSPNVFRNTELIFSNHLANFIQGMGFKGILAEGADHVLGWRSPSFIYTARTAERLPVLLKNYKLSDDIAFRFSNKGWNEHPLTAEKFSRWVNANNGNGHTVNLFMDYETFGEHQWEDTGIFQFMEHLPGMLLRHPDNDFKTPSEVIAAYKPVGELDVHEFVSWADLERDLSAWLGNSIQHSAIGELYRFEPFVKASDDPALLEAWRKLTTSDHFYYMCTKWFNDGDVHKYFNPYDSPYEAYISYMNVLNDLALRLDMPKAGVPISDSPSALLADH
ncbi:MAG: glycoside hydrolase family 57 protein [Nanoarchaeota archaeon]